MTSAPKRSGGVRRLESLRGAPARRALWLSLAVALAAGFLALAPRADQGHGTVGEVATDHRARTIIVVRHAEKDVGGDARDPALSAAGERRAELLARTLEASEVTHLFASEFRRTADTLSPLSKRTGRTVTIIPAREPDRLLSEIRALPPGAVCVVAGHSNTVPKIVAGLGGTIHGLVESPQGAALADESYDRLFVITLPPPSARAACDASIVELRYGD